MIHRTRDIVGLLGDELSLPQLPCWESETHAVIFQPNINPGPILEMENPAVWIIV